MGYQEIVSSGREDDKEASSQGRVGNKRRYGILASLGLVVGASVPAVGFAAVIVADSPVEAAAHKPAPQEAPIPNSEFFRMAKQLIEGVYCDPDNNEVYGIIDHKIEQEPDSSCNSNNTSGSAT